ncbi:MAG: tRNA (adenosine(37)-N6)-threonylcarbamoyltransferase complex ATPase subunit type 1 TsaE [Pelagibacteraceae bacterium]|nr:MAG: tRNA (adenosine(37)-N6)-threonylcarbamoyltransferase complex ATPase subunit type 1 TsaE [Pelagibacteraceae bacterium]
MPTAINSGKIDISSERLIKQLAEKLAKYFKKGDIVFLYGEMGVGKTTFVRYLINQFQINKNLKKTEVTSPTFNLLNEYLINGLNIKHYDLFRLKNKSEIKELNLFEESRDNILFIEWPQIIEKKYYSKTIKLFFNYEDNFQNRSLKIKGLKFLL